MAGIALFGRNNSLCQQHGLIRYTFATHHTRYNRCGLNQGLAFGTGATSDTAVPTSLGIVQPKNGPCGVLAAFQGVVLRSLPSLYSTTLAQNILHWQAKYMCKYITIANAT